MKRYFALLKNCDFFKGITEEQFCLLVDCLQVKCVSYSKNSSILNHGEKITQIGVILSGSVHVIQEDVWGNRVILTQLGTGEMFGESFACAQQEKVSVSILAVQDCEVLLFDFKQILTACPKACEFHTKLIENMMRILATKNIALTQKVFHITKRTTRAKLLSYLSERAFMAESSAFDIPFDRQQLADYLAVDRSAMSAELSRMRADGLIDYQRNHFVLYEVIE